MFFSIVAVVVLVYGLYHRFKNKISEKKDRFGYSKKEYSKFKDMIKDQDGKRAFEDLIDNFENN